MVEQLDRWTVGWITGWLYILMGGGMAEWLACLKARWGGWMAEWLAGWLDGWTLDGWLNGCG